MSQKSYSISTGSKLCDRGPYNAVPADNYLSGDGKSFVYAGPAYYVPSERRWISYHDYRSLPRETRRDAILFESEEEWREYQRKRDRPTQPGGISMSGYPQNLINAPVPVMLPFQRNAWTRPWNGPGFFVPPTDKWIHEHTGPGIPRDSYRFYNEEDWIKYKYQVENPTLKTELSTVI